MKPKNRKEILDTCQNNFWNYSTLTKVLIIFSLVLSAVAVSLYICQYIYPTACSIISGDIVGWHIIWKICLAFILYGILRFINVILISISGVVVCKEENWNVDDFATAWVNVYDDSEIIDENNNFEK